MLLLYHPKHCCWLYPGGHVEEHETPVEAVVREVYEETGLYPSFLPSLPFELVTSQEKILPSPYCVLEEYIPAYKSKDAHRHVDLVYVMEHPYDELTLPYSEVCKWFTYKEIMKLATFPAVKKIASIHLTDGSEEKE